MIAFDIIAFTDTYAPDRDLSYVRLGFLISVTLMVSGWFKIVRMCNRNMLSLGEVITLASFMGSGEVYEGKKSREKTI